MAFLQRFGLKRSGVVALNIGDFGVFHIILISLTLGCFTSLCCFFFLFKCIFLFDYLHVFPFSSIAFTAHFITRFISSDLSILNLDYSSVFPFALIILKLCCFISLYCFSSLIKCVFQFSASHVSSFSLQSFQHTLLLILLLTLSL